MTTTTPQHECTRCCQPALPEPIQVGGAAMRLCRPCFVAFTAEYLTAHDDRAAELAARFQLPWPATGAARLAEIVVAGMEQARAGMG
jgi:hypothetical protein